MKKALPILTVLCIVFSIFACKKEKDNNVVEVYQINTKTTADSTGGTPTIMPFCALKIQGKVTDESGNPIAGIKVATAPRSANTQYIMVNDTLFTSATGEYEIFNGAAKRIVGNFPIIITDVDGENNGGEFVSKTEIVSVTIADYAKYYADMPLAVMIKDFKLNKK